MRALAAAFEKHYPGRPYTYSRLSSPLPDHRALILCSFSTEYVLPYIQFAESIYRDISKAITACGGPHPSARPEQMSEYFDTVCIGEGEITLKEIVDDFDNGGDGLGVVYGKRVGNLDDFPAFPKLLPRLGPIEIMRGCSGSCRYCQTPMLFPGKIRYRSPELIEEEIKFAAMRKALKGAKTDARFIAPDAGAYPNIERLLRLSKNATDGGRIFFGTFPSEIDPLRVTPGLVELMVRHCDNNNAVIGLQSASKRVLKEMNRKAGPDDASRAVELLLGAGYEVIVDFIFAHPFEDEASVEDTINWMAHWKDRVIIHSHPYMPLPGSRWEDVPPAPVPERLLQFLKSLEGRGGIFGGYTL